MFTVKREPMFVARILALHELSEVQSWQSVFQVIGLPEQNMMAPLILRNLKRGSCVPSQIALPIWEPQQASLYVVSL
jgi:hypothetical protein